MGSGSGRSSRGSVAQGTAGWPLRILIADDHALLRRGVRELIAEAYPDAEIVEVGDGPQTLARIEGERWSVVLLDLRMPGQTGLDLLERVLGVRAQLPVIVLSAHEEPGYATRARELGARAYVSKRCAPEQLVAAVATVLRGEAFVQAVQLDARPAHARLSRRELEVLRMLGAGKSVKDVATELGLSEKTVSTYRTRLLDKLELETTASLIRYALRTGLVD